MRGSPTPTPRDHIPSWGLKAVLAKRVRSPGNFAAQEALFENFLILKLHPPLAVEHQKTSPARFENPVNLVKALLIIARTVKHTPRSHQVEGVHVKRYLFRAGKANIHQPPASRNR